MTSFGKHCWMEIVQVQCVFFIWVSGLMLHVHIVHPVCVENV